jgi:hypothetical protein
MKITITCEFKNVEFILYIYIYIYIYACILLHCRHDTHML